MQDLIPFLLQHWALSLTFVVVLGLIIFEERRSSGGGMAVAPAVAVNLINREKAAVVDLRTADEFKNGHIVDAINLPMTDLESKFKSLDKYKERHLLLICPLNKSATLMMAKLRKAGFTKVQLLAGGIGAWTRANLPLVKS